MGNYRWGPDKTIELLNAVQRWEVQVKDTLLRGSRSSKWQWVAAQLFVPDEECDLLKLSKRCERRVALLRTNYVSYFQQRMLMEESLSQAPPSPIKFDAAVWEKMIEFFGERKTIPRRPQAVLPAVAPPLAAASVRKSQKESKVDDNQDSEGESAGAIDQDEPEESSSSSVGSNHSCQSSPPVFLPTTSTGSSYYDISGSDGHADSQGLSRTTAITCNSSSQSSGSSGHYEPSVVADITRSETVSESSSHDEISTALESCSDDADNVSHVQTPAAVGPLTGTASLPSASAPQTAVSPSIDYRTLIEDLISVTPSAAATSALLRSPFETPAALGSVTGTAGPSSPSVPQTAVSREIDYRTLIEFEELYNPSAASAAASFLRVPLKGSSSKSSDSSSTKSKSGSVSCSSAKYSGDSCSCGGFSSGEKSTGQATGDRKQNSRSSASSMLGGMGSRSAQGEVKDNSVVIGAAAGEAGYGGPSERGGISSSKKPREGIGFLFYGSDQHEPQCVRQLPAKFEGLSLNHPPSPAAEDGEDGLAQFMFDDKHSQSSKAMAGSKEPPHAGESGSQSSKPSSKEHSRAQESGNRRVSPSSSSGLRDPSSSPEPSSSTSIVDGNDDNLIDLMVYIKLKLEQPEAQ